VTFCGKAAVSHLYGAIYFRFANEDGLQAGISIGEWTVPITFGQGVIVRA
jgi:hypothetical protein